MQIRWDKGVNPQNRRPRGETRVPDYRKMQHYHSKSTGAEEISEKIKHAEQIDQIRHKCNKSDEPTLRESKED